MNKKQRVILAIFVPVIIFFLALTIVYYTGIADEHFPSIKFPTSIKFPSRTESFAKTYNPFNWEKTWYVWLIFLIFVCIFEYKLFKDKKEK